MAPRALFFVCVPCQEFTVSQLHFRGTKSERGKKEIYAVKCQVCACALFPQEGPPQKFFLHRNKKK